LLQTAGRWPWKSESAKECVTTHLPKQLALKMDGASASNLNSPVGAKCKHVPTCRKVAAIATKVSGVGQPGAVAGADLGGSSKDTSEILVG
jgi:hypothetical protein